MAETIKLSKFDNQPWGFRMQGGKDFGLPLTISRVTGGSLAEKAGLRAGDLLLQINDTPVANLTHKGCQDTIFGAGNNFVLSVSRGAAPASAPGYPQSLPRPVRPPQPLQVPNPPAPGTPTGAPAVPLEAQPVELTEDNIAETLSSQAEVIRGSTLGVNFKKYEKTYEHLQNSAVFQLIHGLTEDEGSNAPHQTWDEQQFLLQQQHQKQQKQKQEQKQQQQQLRKVHKQQKQQQEQQAQETQETEQQETSESTTNSADDNSQPKSKPLPSPHKLLKSAAPHLARQLEVLQGQQEKEDDKPGPSYPAGINYRPSYPLTAAAPLPPRPVLPPPRPVQLSLGPLPVSPITTPTGPQKPLAKPACATTCLHTQPWKPVLPIWSPASTPNATAATKASDADGAPKAATTEAQPATPDSRPPGLQAADLYDEDSIAETLTSQAELLCGRALGVNFKKYERKPNGRIEDSDVYKMLHGLDESRPPRVAHLPERVEASSKQSRAVLYNQLLQKTLRPSRSRSSSGDTYRGKCSGGSQKSETQERTTVQQQEQQQRVSQETREVSAVSTKTAENRETVVSSVEEISKQVQREVQEEDDIVVIESSSIERELEEKQEEIRTTTQETVAESTELEEEISKEDEKRVRFSDEILEAEFDEMESADTFVSSREYISSGLSADDDSYIAQEDEEEEQEE